MVVQVADAEAEKNCLRARLVALAIKRSEETLKLLMNFEMIKKSSFVMDQIKTKVNKGGKQL